MPAPTERRAVRWVVVSDLDGTLLAHDTYDWRPAEPALRELRRRRIPLVFCSSKTRAEIERWRSRLDNRDPFVSENGGAIFLPDRSSAGRYEIFPLGTPYARLREALASLRAKSSLPLRGFGDMAPEEIARLAGVDLAEACLAAQREFDEPFLFEETPAPEDLRSLERAAAALGLKLLRGGRFFHLTGGNDKGLACRRLREILGAEPGGTGAPRPLMMAAAGDSPNDREMLLEADYPILVQRPGGRHDPALVRSVPGAWLAPGEGPEGFRLAVRRLVEEHDPRG